MIERSAIYTGRVMHHRLQPKHHSLRYNVFWLAIDLDDLESLPTQLRLFSYNRFNIFSLHDCDYGDGSSLKHWIRNQLAAVGLTEAGTKIQLVTMPRIFGYAFNPISIYFCRCADGALSAILYEVHNTFGERHHYLFAIDDPLQRHKCSKVFHVSPFLDMDMNYSFRTAVPDQRLALEIIAYREERPMLTACMVGRRNKLSDGSLLKALLAMPLLTFKVTAAIHWHAIQLWLKGLRLRHRPQPPAETTTFTPRKEAHEPRTTRKFFGR